MSTITAALPRTAKKTAGAKPWGRLRLRRWIIEESFGWTTLRHGCKLRSETDPLAVHAAWHGPVKLTRGDDGELEKRIEFYVDDQLRRESDPLLDKGRATAFGRLIRELEQVALAAAKTERVESWSGPPIAGIQAWLAACGYATTLDADKNLRLTLNRPGFAGQVLITRDDHGLRLTMRLGKWSKLPDAGKKAMRELVGEANDRLRLVRLVWTDEKDHTTAEALVDLTGLPWSKGEKKNPCHDAFWQALLAKSVAALEVALEQLALELEVLADPANQELAELLV